MARSGRTKRRPKPSVPQGPRDAALIIFAKAPIPGQVKTRLCPPLNSDEAATLHGSVVLDTVERSRSVREVDRFLACAPSKDHPFFKVLANRHGLTLWEQKGEDLGIRMHHALNEAFDKGYKYSLLVGTDLPALPTTTYTQALQLLATHDVVFGPTLDGGYYLIGLKQPLPDVFTDIPWSTEQVLELSQHKARTAGLTVGLLRAQRDLDTIEDLETFMTESRGPNKHAFSTRTVGVFQALAKRLPTRKGVEGGTA